MDLQYMYKYVCVCIYIYIILIAIKLFENISLDIYFSIVSKIFL